MRMACGLGPTGDFPTNVAGKYGLEKLKKMVEAFHVYLDGTSEAARGLSGCSREPAVDKFKETYTNLKIFKVVDLTVPLRIIKIL